MVQGREMNWKAHESCVTPKVSRLTASLTMLLASLIPLPLYAQETATSSSRTADSNTEEQSTPIDRSIDFEADILSYDSPSDTVTASGNVLLRSGDRTLRANRVSWNRPSGEITATGRVRFVDENGNQLYSDSITLTDECEAGAMEDLLLALRQGGRLAAESGARMDDGTI